MPFDLAECSVEVSRGSHQHKSCSQDAGLSMPSGVLSIADEVIE
jgi:hypothetical protein